MATYGKEQQQPASHAMLKMVATMSIGVSMLVLAGLTLVSTMIALTMATLLLVIFSPVLMPIVMAYSCCGRVPDF